MNKQKSFSVVWILILLIALVSIGFKASSIPEVYEDFLPKKVYEVQYNFYSKGKEKKIFVKSYQPINNERQKISKIKQVSKKMSFVVKEEEENKRLIWRAKDQRKFHTIKYHFIFSGKAAKYVIADDLPIPNSYPDLDPKYTQGEEHIEIYDEKIVALAAKLSQQTIDLKSLIKNLYDYVYQMPSAPIRDLTSAVTALEQNQASCNGKARLFVALCRANGLPARLKGGLILEDTKKRTSHLWTEVYIQDQWVPFDVLNGHFGYIPAHYMEIYTGDHFLITHTPNILFDYNYIIKEAGHIPFVNDTVHSFIKKNPVTLLQLAKSDILPDGVLHFLLVLPLGGLLIALCKNVIGLKTYGVFLPVLIAYTLTGTGYVNGMLLFLLIIAIVAVISIPLNAWGLLYTPKIVVILTATILMVFALLTIAVLYQIQWLKALSFFPIIITAIVAERFARAVEEDGYRMALSKILQTLFATSLCYLIFSSLVIQTILLVFPELILICLVISLLLGKWIGLRLSEYRRFYFLLDNELK